MARDRDPAPLRRLTTNGDATVAVLADGGLVTFGDPAGFAGLRRAVEDPKPLRGSEPPITIADYAARILARVIGPTANPPRPTDRATAGTAWAAWLDAHVATLAFDATTATWGPR